MSRSSRAPDADSPDGPAPLGATLPLPPQSAAEAGALAYFAAAPDATVVVDGTGLVVAASARVTGLLGYTADELVGTTVDRLLPDGLRATHVHHRRSYAEDPQVRPMGNGLELVAQAKDGSLVPVDIMLSPVRTHGRPLVLAAIRDATARKAVEAALTTRALHDTLTGLPNRALLVDRLAQALARGLRSEGAVGVYFLDLDRFKVVNDAKGHAAGDELLVAVARRLAETVRPSDTIARFGGDEFVAVAEGFQSAEEAAQYGERLRACLLPPFVAAGATIHIGASVGIATSTGSSSPEELLRSADSAMYRAKESGRNRVEVFAQVMHEEAKARLETEEFLRGALDRQELSLVYQPIIDLRRRRIIAMEALMRWRHPQMGQVSPATFIKIAEEVGLIGSLGRFALDTASATLKGLRASGHPGLRASVNLSPRQFERGAVEELLEWFAGSALVVPALTVEITESILVADRDTAVVALEGLRALGVRVAIDDFGTGYSSLGYLRHFPIDIIKIDGSLIEQLGVDAGASAIVAAVVQLAHGLGMTVTAEGVEHPRQLRALVSLGCDSAQGFLISPPLPRPEIDQLLAASPTWSPRHPRGGRARPGPDTPQPARAPRDATGTGSSPPAGE